MGSDRSRQDHKARRLALFPGAFRPPHKAHDAAVRYLAARPDVDEVVVIVTNRSRGIPGTTKALDSDVALAVWEIYLQDLANVTVEIAPSTAVEHALGYIDRAEPGDSLLFCLGAGDHDGGDPRFREIETLAARKGVAAALTVAPTAHIPARATELRAALAQGQSGRTDFLAALPDHLGADEGDRVWRICRHGMRELSEITRQKVGDLIARMSLGDVAAIQPARPGRAHEMLRVDFRDGRRLFAKYAHDMAAAPDPEDPRSSAPWDRFSAERRAIGRLRKVMPEQPELPEVLCFDKKHKVLMLSEVCPGGRPLESDLAQGRFDPKVARAAGRFLGRSHSAAKATSALRGSKANDLAHWRRILALEIRNAAGAADSARTRQDLDALARASDAARADHLLHLRFCPRNILVGEERIGVIDFELNSSLGDPAYDLGRFLAHYIYWGAAGDSGPSCRKAVEAMLAAYREEIGDAWGTMHRRIAAFAGAGLLSCLAAHADQLAEAHKARLQATAAGLLARGPDATGEAETLLIQAIGARSERPDEERGT